MRVSELARRAGITPSAIRFYEAEGVLPPPLRGTNGYREYDDLDLCRVRIVAVLRGLGLELDASGRLAGLCASGRCDEMAEGLLPLLARRRADIAAARAELDHVEAELARLEDTARTGQPRPTLCLEREKGGDACDHSP